MVIFLVTGQKAYSQFDIYKYPAFNWGVQVGLNAFSTNYYNVYSGEVELVDEYTQNNVGYNLAVFVRINLNRFFIQPEFMWNIYDQKLFFSLTDANNSFQIPMDISVKSYAGNVNTIVGYNITKNGPFIFNVLLGPSIKYIYRTKYEITSNSDLINKEPYYKYTGIIGFSINIAKTHFDIRYEFNSPNSDIYLNKLPDIQESLQNICIYKNENILNFSFGLMF